MRFTTPAIKIVLFLGISLTVQTVCAGIVTNTLESEDGTVSLTEKYELDSFGEYKVTNNNSDDIHFVFVGNNDGSSPDATIAYVDWASTTIAKVSGLPGALAFSSTSLTWSASWEDYFPNSDSVFAFYRSDSSTTSIVGGGGIADSFGWTASSPGSDFATDFVVFGAGGSVITQSQDFAVAEPGPIMLLGFGLLVLARRRM